MASERDIVVGSRTYRVRDGGSQAGWPIIYFHGTPGSRLDVSLADEAAAEGGVRLISFDRPGYGGSTPAAFSLRTVGDDVHELADALELGRFSTLGFSGGGPFALAAAAGNERVAAVGVADGAGAFEEVAGALEDLDDNDRLAYGLLATDRQAAAAQFAEGFAGVAEAAAAGPEALVAYFGPSFNDTDAALFGDPAIAESITLSVREALGSSRQGAGWDNVAWIGPWDIDLKQVRCPVVLWYGSEDRFATVDHGAWQAAQLPDARLVVRPGEGHFGHIAHLPEVFAALRWQSW
jgi:pimeloyl-ACP methyl ester carboxylesterase